MSAEQNQSILIVEDDERLALLTKDYFQKNGYSVDIESDGNRAIDKILETKPSLVILDLMLPLSLIHI